MAAPKYIPSKPNTPAVYSSPPQRFENEDPESEGVRPGETRGQTESESDSVGSLGSPGPDQGYAIGLAKTFEDKLNLSGLSSKDAMAGCTALGLKRASLYGRAPVIHDLRAAFCIYGFLNSSVNPRLIELRSKLFREVHHDVHYSERRRIVDLVDVSFLKTPIAEIEANCAKDWQQAFKKELLSEYI